MTSAPGEKHGGHVRKTLSTGVGAFALVLLAWLPWRETPARRPAAPRVGPAMVGSTSPATLQRTIESSRGRVAADPGDGEAAVLLADALMRAARVQSNASLALEAERVLRAALSHDPADYGVQRMLGVVYLSQHRFAEALQSATAAQAAQPDDAWNYAVAGDALLELGRYGEAFDAFDRVASRRPDAAAYARVAYARELQGDIDGALRVMGMAMESTAPDDVEARAWLCSQIGSLYLAQGQLHEADREFARAEFMFPSHPYAIAGRVRVAIARGRHEDALRLDATAAETPESLALRGDLLQRLGRRAAAEEAYRAAERLEREGWKQEQPQPAALARFLAERGRDLPQAVALAEAALKERRDIHTLDAAAWSYFKSGRLEDAAAAIAEATRTGTADVRIRCHESAIAAARAGAPTISEHRCDPLDMAARR
jgi:tetratricopeptide (TPR) repeat protein